MRAAHPYRRRKVRQTRRPPASKPVAPSFPSAQAPSVAETPVTDHAILRYLERFEGVDIAAARERLRRLCCTDRAKELIEFGGASTYRLRVDGGTFCLRSGRIVTCYP